MRFILRAGLCSPGPAVEKKKGEFREKLLYESFKVKIKENSTADFHNLLSEDTVEGEITSRLRQTFGKSMNASPPTKSKKAS